MKSRAIAILLAVTFASVGYAKKVEPANNPRKPATGSYESSCAARIDRNTKFSVFQNVELNFELAWPARESYACYELTFEKRGNWKQICNLCGTNVGMENVGPIKIQSASAVKGTRSEGSKYAPDNYKIVFHPRSNGAVLEL
ncbi:MAG: hypothetical protein AB7H97_06920, partial [Pseudobdellovibrionaceae bacterium]